MNSLSISDVMSEDFSIEKTSHDQRVEVFASKIKIARETIILAKKAKYPTMSNYYVYDGELLSAIKITNDELIHLVFSRDFYNKILNLLNCSNSFSWSLNTKIFSFIKSNAEIAEVSFRKSHMSSVRDFIIMEGLLKIEDLQNIVSSEKDLVIQLHKSCISHLFDLMDHSFAKNFLDHRYSEVRKAAYRKIGIMNSIDKMISDPDAEIRLLAVRALPYNDSRHEKFINDRSSKVFTVSLSKIERTKLPLLLGSSHLKKPRIKSILSERMISE
jgi:hypothetical protein